MKITLKKHDAGASEHLPYWQAVDPASTPAEVQAKFRSLAAEHS